MSLSSAHQRAQRKQLLEARAHGMRHALSPAEARLWQAIRARQLGVEFRRQVVLADRYIADFLAQEARLVVEVDGAQHAHTRSADAKRDRVLLKLGYRTLRFAGKEVHGNLEGVLERLRAALSA